MPKKPEQLSVCCDAMIGLVTTMHGENPLMCMKCKKPTRPSAPHDINMDLTYNDFLNQEL